MTNIRNIAAFFIITFAIVVILILGRSILIPFVFAILLWFIVRSIRIYMDRVPVIKKRIPAWIKNAVSFLFILAVFNFIFNIVFANAKLLASSYEKYKGNFYTMTFEINKALNINLLDEIRLFIDELDFMALFLSAFNYSTELLSSAFMVLLYAVFLFLEESSFRIKIRKLFKDDHLDNVYDMMKKTEHSITKYLGMKTLLSLITATLSFIVLKIIGVDFPVFWAFLIFVLNFIPFIGSILATLFPVVFSFLQFGVFMPGILVLIFVGAIQIVIGNFLDPKLMANSINLSPLVIILSLSFWGAVWGITGMLLSVPIMGIIVIVCSKFQKTKPIAIVLSGDGEID
jgi:predicted PurR-regulated permease PerM